MDSCHDGSVSDSSDGVIVAVNFHQRWVFFADFSVNSTPIPMKFHKHSFQLFRRLPWKFREIWMSISKVRPFDM